MGHARWVRPTVKVVAAVTIAGQGRCGGRPARAAGVENEWPNTGAGGRCVRDLRPPMGEAATGSIHAFPVGGNR
jgi:hypothetical protein